MIPDEVPRKYYYINEVAEMLSVNNSTVRFWSDTFDLDIPRSGRVANGYRRKYTSQNIQELKEIQYLLKVRKMRIEPALELFQSQKNLSRVGVPIAIY